MVTILILIDGFLQLLGVMPMIFQKKRHNPYFNRWFSAIKYPQEELQAENRHNPYFNRWFSAIKGVEGFQKEQPSHNPYFNRWFSAIMWNTT